MRVLKFGGAVLRSPEGFRRMASIIRAEVREDDAPVLVVVSAFSTATRDMEFAARLAVKSMLDEATERLTQVMDDHRTLVRALMPPSAMLEAMDALIAAAEQDLRTLLHGICVTRQLTPRTLDRVLAYGEFLALHIARHILEADGVESASVDATSYMVTDADHGNAAPLLDKTKMRVEHEVRPLLATHRVVLTQGFVGRNEEGATTTMGRESSNLTATLLGSILGAEEVVIVTDVAGVRSADPHVCERTMVRPRMSYADARYAAAHGLKLLYPTMIDPAEHAGIPIRITSAADYSGECTSITSGEHSPGSIVILTSPAADTRMADVTVLFAPAAAWLAAAAKSTALLKEDDAFYVVGGGSQAPRMTVPVDRAASIARFFHQELVLN